MLKYEEGEPSVIEAPPRIDLRQLFAGGENFNFPHYNKLLEEVDILNEVDEERNEKIEKGVLGTILDNGVVKQMFLGEWRTNINEFSITVSNTLTKWKERVKAFLIITALTLSLLTVIYIGIKVRSWKKKNKQNTIIKATYKKLTETMDSKDKSEKKSEEVELDEFTKELLESYRKK